MKINSRAGIIATLALTFCAGFALAGIVLPRAAEAKFDLGGILGDALKVGGVKIAVDQFGGELDKVINKLYNDEDYPLEYDTKVVIILSPIGNKHIGAAQVTGPRDMVEKTEAVLQLETSFMDKLFRIKGMVPVDSENPGTAKRVPGVGVSAVIDIKL